QLHYGAVRALLAMDDPEAWRRARTELDRLHAAGAIDAWQYGGGTSQLDAALADPEGFIAKRRRPGMDPRDRALAEARRPLDARATFARTETYALELDDRAAAVAQYRHLLGDERGLVAGPRREARPWERWLKYEIRDLQTGRRFAGRVGREDLVAGALGPIAV